jgi:four helix bundle protein
VDSGQQVPSAPTPKVIDFKDLLVWQKGMALTKKVYELTAQFPAEEKFGLTSQMRRAAVSVPSNIAEGQVRRGTREFVQFLAHVTGSLAELETQLRLVADLGFAKAGETDPVASELREIQRMIAGIQRKLALKDSGQ